MSLFLVFYGFIFPFECWQVNYNRCVWKYYTFCSNDTRNTRLYDRFKKEKEEKERKIEKGKKKGKKKRKERRKEGKR